MSTVEYVALILPERHLERCEARVEDCQVRMGGPVVSLFKKRGVSVGEASFRGIGRQWRERWTQAVYAT